MDEEKRRREAKTFDEYLMTYLTDDYDVIDKKDKIQQDKMLFEEEKENIKEKTFSYKEIKQDRFSNKEETEEDIEKNYNNTNTPQIDFMPTFIMIISLIVSIAMIMIKGIEVFNGIESMIVAIIWAMVLVYVSIIVHECGHLFFGLISGYKFASFRISNMMLVKNDGRLTYKKYHINGSGGQCLMVPPDLKDENYDFPYFLYSLGGAIFNLLFAIICFLLYIILPYIIILSEGFIIATGLGVYFGLLNGIPRKIGEIANDGANALYLDENLDNKKAFYSQLKINGLLTMGKSYRDMDEKLFEINENADFKNPLISSMTAFRCSYLIDLREFEKAREFIEYALNNFDGMLGVHKSELKSELLFLELIGECSREKIDQIYDDNLKRYMFLTRNYYVSRLRQYYAYALLYEQDEKKAKGVIDDFEILKRTYPYEVEVAQEIGLLHLVHDEAIKRGIIEEEPTSKDS